jgi:hypothetical protein
VKPLFGTQSAKQPFPERPRPSFQVAYSGGCVVPDRASSRNALLSDAEAESLRLQLLEVIPRLRRHHLLDLADTLHEAARERRWSPEERLDMRA